MEDKGFDEMLGHALGQDFSVGTEAFRDALLERCLAVLNDDGGQRALGDGCAGPQGDSEKRAGSRGAR